MPWIIAAIAIAFFAGVFLCIRGLRSRRRDGVPFCRRCGYNLTGVLTAQPPRCPECGTDVTPPRAVIHGTRIRRKALLIPGLVLLVLALTAGGVLGAGYAKRVDWYQYRPTAWVLDDLEHGGLPARTRAGAELWRRLTADQLESGQLTRLTKICLAKQERTPGDFTALSCVLGLLDTLYTRDQFAPADRQRYLDSLVRYKLLARKVVGQGQDFSVDLCECQSGNSTLMQETRVEAILVDGKPVEPSHGFTMTGSVGCGRGTSWTPPLRIDTLGKHQVQVQARVTICAGKQGDSGSIGEVLHQSQQMVTTEIEVVPDEPPDMVRLVHTAELDASICSHVRMAEFRRNGAERSPQRWAEAMVWYHERYKTSTVAVAFEVFVQIDGQLTRCGTLAFGPENPLTVGTSVVIPQAADVAGQVTMVLRSSRVVARASPIMEDVWDGELWFHNVPVLDPEPGRALWTRPGFVPELRRRDPEVARLTDSGQAGLTVREILHGPLAPEAPATKPDLAIGLADWISMFRANTNGALATQPATRPARP